eukprot:TRINITY_DN3810_c2_g5_i1.p1 TRINITY_DN3810_c2_g5~~TRINITY_DN3810_c2_g5_i1.p1  ORF type:complete len:473 (-),score=103.72 TRINITY_DN3810_c2_g5_i1:28-1446(-)
MPLGAGVSGILSPCSSPSAIKLSRMLKDSTDSVEPPQDTSVASLVPATGSNMLTDNMPTQIPTPTHTPNQTPTNGTSSSSLRERLKGGEPRSKSRRYHETITLLEQLVGGNGERDSIADIDALNRREQLLRSSNGANSIGTGIATGSRTGGDDLDIITDRDWDWDSGDRFGSKDTDQGRNRCAHDHATGTRQARWTQQQLHTQHTQEQYTQQQTGEREGRRDWSVVVESRRHSSPPPPENIHHHYDSNNNNINTQQQQELSIGVTPPSSNRPYFYDNNYNNNNGRLPLSRSRRNSLRDGSSSIPMPPIPTSPTITAPPHASPPLSRSATHHPMGPPPRRTSLSAMVRRNSATARSPDPQQMRAFLLLSPSSSQPQQQHQYTQQQQHTQAGGGLIDMPPPPISPQPQRLQNVLFSPLNTTSVGSNNVSLPPLPALVQQQYSYHTQQPITTRLQSPRVALASLPEEDNDDFGFF